MHLGVVPYRIVDERPVIEQTKRPPIQAKAPRPRPRRGLGAARPSDRRASEMSASSNTAPIETNHPALYAKCMELTNPHYYVTAQTTITIYISGRRADTATA
jgi:hypothetical protein